MDAFVPDPTTGAAKPGTRRPAIFCTVEEDGGAVAIANATDSDAMMRRFEPPLDRLRMTPKGGSSESDGSRSSPTPGTASTASSAWTPPPAAPSLAKSKAW